MKDIKEFKSISAIWGDEHKTVAECAEKICAFMKLLKNHNIGLFTGWYEQAMSLKEALELKVEINQEYFYNQVENNWNKKFPDLGTQVWLWTGQEQDGYSAVINFSLGKHPNNPNLSNACVIKLPRKGKYMEYYGKKENQQALIHLMQKFWQPDFLKINGERIDRIV